MEVVMDLDLPVRTVSLPAPEDFSRPVSANSDIARIAKEYAKIPDNFAIEAGVFHGNDLSVSWKVLHKAHALELYPLEFEADRLQGNGSRVRLLIPSVVLPHCVTICDSGENFVVDFITDSGYLYTVIIPHLWLRNGSDKSYNIDSPDLSLKMTRQQSLDLVAPRILKAVSPQTLLLALVDGDLVRLDRSSPNASPTPSTLSNNFSKPAGSGLARFFKTGNERVPGHPRFSVNAASSLDIIGTCALTYSINNTVHLWSLLSNSCVQSISPDTTTSPPRLRPTTYIAHHGSTVAVAFPDAVKLYNLHANERLVPREEPDKSVQPIPEEVRSWFVTSFGILEGDKILISFKQNLCARVYVTTAEHKWTLVGGYDHTALMDLPITNSLERTKKRVMETNPAVVKLALSQLSVSNSISPSTSPVLLSSSSPAAAEKFDETITDFFQSLDEKVNTVFARDGDSLDVESQWLRLDTLCREIQTQGGELLAIEPALSTNNGMFLWSLRVSGVSIFCIQEDDKKMTDDDKNEGEAYDISQDLLGNVPEPTLERVAEIMLSPDIVTQRIETSCALLRNYIHQKKLNDMGRTISDKVAPALRQYIEAFGPARSESSENISGTPLSQLGKDAVTMLVHDFATKYASKFREIVSLTIIAMVEGWLAGPGDPELLRSTVEVLRRYTFISTLGLKNLHLNVENVYLPSFGISLARNIAHDCNEVDVLAGLLPPNQPEMSLDIAANFFKAASVCNPSPQLTLLQSLAHLSTGDTYNGSELARRVSLSLPWVGAIFGDTEKPATQSRWFYEMARYATSLPAEGAALTFAQYGVSLPSANKEDANLLLDLLFELSLRHDDIAVAYTALTRRFPTFIESKEEEELVEKWIHDLITAAAHVNEETARSIVVSYPFIGLSRSLQKTLATTSSFATIPSYKLLYAWYIKRDDFVGAAEVLYAEIQRGTGDYARKAELYTVCLNALSLVAPDARWLNYDDVIIHFDDLKLQQDQLLKKIALHIDMDD